ncbi:MAG: hypothetical protein ACQESR_00145 [Planctomycetota bacterium]
MERCPTQAVLPLVGLAADKVIRDRYINAPRQESTLSFSRLRLLVLEMVAVTLMKGSSPILRLTAN